MALLPKGKREQSLVFVAFLAFIGVGAHWHFIYNKQAADFEAKEQRIEALVSLNQKAKAEMAKGNPQQLRRQLAEYQQNLNLIRTLIPTGNEVPSLLEQVSTAARRVGLDLASVDPQPVVDGGDYATYRYSVAVLGGYHQLGQFLGNVGSLTRIIVPANVTLSVSASPGAAARKKPNAAVVEARFQLQTYVARKSAISDDAPPSLTRKSGEVR